MLNIWTLLWITTFSLNPESKQITDIETIYTWIFSLSGQTTGTIADIEFDRMTGIFKICEHNSDIEFTLEISTGTTFVARFPSPLSWSGHNLRFEGFDGYSQPDPRIGRMFEFLCMAFVLKCKTNTIEHIQPEIINENHAELKAYNSTANKLFFNLMDKKNNFRPIGYGSEIVGNLSYTPKANEITTAKCYYESEFHTSACTYLIKGILELKKG